MRKLSHKEIKVSDLPQLLSVRWRLEPRHFIPGTPHWTADMALLPERILREKNSMVSRSFWHWPFSFKWIWSQAMLGPEEAWMESAWGGERLRHWPSARARALGADQNVHWSARRRGCPSPAGNRVPTRELGALSVLKSNTVSIPVDYVTLFPFQV